MALSTPFSDKKRFTSSRPDAVLVAPISAKTQKQQTSNEGGWILRSGSGELRETGSILTAPPAATTTDPNISAFSTVTLTSLTDFEDTRPQN